MDRLHTSQLAAVDRHASNESELLLGTGHGSRSGVFGGQCCRLSPVKPLQRCHSTKPYMCILVFRGQTYTPSSSWLLRFAVDAAQGKYLWGASFTMMSNRNSRAPNTGFEGVSSFAYGLCCATVPQAPKLVIGVFRRKNDNIKTPYFHPQSPHPLGHCIIC